ncbi:hypothetical protein WJX73_005261 [Symbiochloris irregularis]|uniref:Ribosome control protein 1 domain-containing protein n=1 Tax=Symbiochloris irregularis TaxID=706552 RepID=A0AAW1NV31_9CHLO
MYFTYGWPKVLSAFPGDVQEDIIYLHSDHDYLVIVSVTSIQLWTGGQHRVKRGQLTRDEASLKQEGLNRKACWSSSKKLLAVLTYHNVLHIYGVHHSKELALSVPASKLGSVPALDVYKVNIYLQYSVPLEASDAASTATTTALVADSRSVLVAFSDGTCQLLSWAGQLRGTARPLANLAEVSALMDLPRTLSSASRTLSGWPSTTLTRLQSTGLSPHFSASAASPRFALGALGRSASAERTASGGMRRSGSTGSGMGDSGMGACIDWLDYAVGLRLLAALMGDGRCAILRASEDTGLFPPQHIEFSHWICSPGSGATCVRIGAKAQLVALGLSSGEVAIHRLWPSSKAGTDPIRILSLADWGYEPEATGSVADLQWSPDDRVLAVGWRRSGLGLWTPSGCRLMCSLRQTATSAPPRTPKGLSKAAAPPTALEAGMAALAWGPHGFRLTVAESGSAAQVVELACAHSVATSHRIVTSELKDASQRIPGLPPEAHLLLADDRLLLISDRQRPALVLANDDAPSSSPFGGESEAASLMVQHLRPPAAYIGANWPLSVAALSSDGLDVAVAGLRGMALYSRRSARWRLFGDISQERELAVQSLLWLPRMVLACASTAAWAGRGASAQQRAAATAATKSGVQLLVFPRFHLDSSSLLGRHPLPQAPLAMDTSGSHVIVAAAPLDITVFRVDLTGALSPQGTAVATFTLVRQLSIMGSGHPLQDIALVDMPSLSIGAARRKGSFASVSSAAEAKTLEAQFCLLMRAGGHLSVLDMEQGSELSLADDIESFWVADRSRATALESTPSTASGSDLPEATAAEPDASEASSSGREQVEIPWWTYGARGMQLWFPSSLAEPLSPGPAGSRPLAEDPELEFDREVYPIGISLSDVSVIGVTQRLHRLPTPGQPPGTPRASASRADQRIAHTSLPAFHPLPESQPVLPCLLRRLLQQGQASAAETLAREHTEGPHFAQSMEWLLFTALEANSALLGSSPNRRKPTDTGPKPPRKEPATAGPQLQAAADLIRQFPQFFPDCVVSVARKTDAALWPSLFAAVGQPSMLAESLLAAGELHHAANALLIVDRLQGSELAHQLALRLMQVSLDEEQYQLAAEVLRFVHPLGEQDSSPTATAASPFGKLDISAGQPSARSMPTADEQQKGGGGWWGMIFSVQPNGAKPSAAQKASHTSAPDPEGAQPSSGAQAHALAALCALHLLGLGDLRAMARLADALAGVGAHLPDMLSGHTVQAPLSDMACLQALEAVDAELAVATDREAHRQAQLLLEACQAAGALEWVFALALFLDNGPALAELSASRSHHWQVFRGAVLNEQHWLAFWPTIQAVDRAAGPAYQEESVRLEAAGVGASAPLVDKEGFPRADIDVHAVRKDRNRIAGH